MIQVRVFRAEALLAEFEFEGESLEIGDRVEDAVRWDALGLDASPGWGGRLTYASGRWRFQPRDGTALHTLPPDGRLAIGAGELEIVAESRESVFDLRTLPADRLEPVEMQALPTGGGPDGERLGLLARFLQDARGDVPPKEVMQRALTHAFSLVGCVRGLVALTEGDALRVIVSRGFDGEDPSRELSRRVLERVLGESRDVFTGNAPVDIPTVTLDLQDIRAICALPLRIDGTTRGVLYVDRGANPCPFTSEDHQFLQLLAAQLAVRLGQQWRLEASETERRRLVGKLSSAKSASGERLAWDSPAMQRVRRDAERLLRAFQGRSLPVLVTGESGTGKEVLARWLHANLEGDAGPFVAVNCGAIPKDLAESELFGIEQGVASGVMRRAGRFQQADGGTLFLDEVGETDLPIQTKLLRALESRSIVRVGGRQEIPVDLRIISATNAPLSTLIEKGEFREDLFWRLNGVEIRMPALRERAEDIPALCDIFAHHFANDFGMPTPTFSEESLAILQAWSWPGNVRELKQRVGAMVALAGTGRIEAQDVAPELRGLTRSAGATGGGVPTQEPRRGIRATETELVTLETLERRHIERVLEITKGNLTQAADILGVHKKTLRRRLDAWSRTTAEV